jgi:deazaflavin-dependent oxidoreductase (nitroreductase family)
MKLSRNVARFNKAINNRVQGVYAPFLPPWAVLLHKGRRSGKPYRTPVLAFRKDGRLIVALLYGTESDWLRNMTAAGGGRFVRGGHTWALGAPRVTPTSETPELKRLNPIARAYCRLSDNQVVMDIGAREPGFGRGRT